MDICKIANDLIVSKNSRKEQFGLLQALQY